METIDFIQTTYALDAYSIRVFMNIINKQKIKLAFYDNDLYVRQSDDGLRDINYHPIRTVITRLQNIQQGEFEACYHNTNCTCDNGINISEIDQSLLLRYLFEKSNG